MLATSAPGFVKIEINAWQFSDKHSNIYFSKTSSAKTQLA